MKSKTNSVRFTLAAVFGVLAMLALIAYVIQSPEGHRVTALFAGIAGIIPFLGIVDVLPEQEFQSRVLGGIEAQKKAGDALKAEIEAHGKSVHGLTAKYDELDRSTKKAFDELTAMKKHANDSQASFDATVRKIGEIEQRLAREHRAGYGDPMQRISGDERLRQTFNIAVRMAMDQGGDMQRVIRNGYQKDIVQRALGETSSPGSTIIDDVLAAELYDTLARYGIWNTFQVMRVGTRQTKLPVATARPVANFILTEAGTIADDANKTGTSVTLQIEVIAALLNVSRQLLDDSTFDVTSVVLDDFGQAVANRLDYACLQATGAADATNGGMTGIFGGGGTAAAAAATHATVELTTLSDWTGTLLAVDPAVLQRPAKWWMHPQIIVRAINVKDSNGRPIFYTANEAPTVGGLGSILGYPVVPCQAAPTANVATSKVAVFGDPAGQVVGVRSDFAFEASDQFRWNTYERSFRAIARAGTKIRRATAFGVLTLTA